MLISEPNQRPLGGNKSSTLQFFAYYSAYANKNAQADLKHTSCRLFVFTILWNIHMLFDCKLTNACIVMGYFGESAKYCMTAMVSSCLFD